MPLVSRDATPSQIAATRDLHQAIRDRLHGDLLWLTEQRLAGRTWVELAREKQATPDGLRVRWVRALQRIAKELKSATDG